MAGLGSPAEFRQLPKYVDGRVDSRSRHVPRARTKENMECFLDDTVFIKVMHSCGRAVRRGRGCLQGRGLCFGTISPVCRRGSLGCAHSQGRCWMYCRVAVPWAHSCVPALAGSQQTPALCTRLMPCFFCFLPWALSSYLSPPHGHGMALPTCVLSPEQAAHIVPALDGAHHCFPCPCVLPRQQLVCALHCI